MKTTYSVYSCNDHASMASSGLTAAEVVRTIYTDDGKDYRLEPALLINQTDEDDNPLPDVQETDDNGKLVFEIWFKDRFGWRNAWITATGASVEDAEAQFLQECFDGTRWNKEWIVLTDEQYQQQFMESEQ